MARCPAITRKNTPCQGVVQPSDTYCVAHDPARAEQRSRTASKAAKSKPNRDFQALSARVEELYAEVRSGTVEPKAGAVLTQLLNTKARVLELGRRLKETENLEARLDALETAEAEAERLAGSGDSWG